MLTDKKFRADVVTYIDDPVVKNFWVTEFASWNDKFASEAVAPVLNKVGAFTANPMVRNIIGQPKSTFNLRQIMDQGKILIVNLSRGLMGEDNAGILGAMMVTKIQLAAMGRADMPEDQRKPFYLYVDEFQNFATDSFAVILSEARKYGLNLTVANQYISQMGEPVRDAVFGNVGTILSFRVSPDDAPFLQKYFEPQFEAGDLIQQHARFFVATMIINGEKATPFSAKTLNLPTPPVDSSKEIIELSRQRYGKNKAEVEARVRQATGLEGLPDSLKPIQTPLRPKAEARLNDLDGRRSASAAEPSGHIGKLATHPNIISPDIKHPQNQAGPPSKRRRRSRRHKSAAVSDGQVIIPPDKPAEQANSFPSRQMDDDQVIKLR